MSALNLLIKPASSGCNLNCKYCFYNDVAKNREVKNFGMMQEATLENIVEKAYEYVDVNIVFGFQGGEPLLRGREFFYKFIEYVKKYNTKNIQTVFTVQTNGTLVDDEWAKFFSDNNFLVGLSLDGYKDIHDFNRIDNDGKGSFNKVLKTSMLFDKYKVEYNVVAVVTKQTAKHVAKVYRYFKDMNFNYMQFIPCLEPFGEETYDKVYSLTDKLYGDFLVKLFNLWYNDIKSGKLISIRMFDNLISILLGSQPEACDMQGICAKGTIVESDGSVYPCDFYVVDKYNCGNLNEVGFDEILANKRMDEFVDVSKNIIDECYSCEFYKICRGGCRRYKEPIKDGEKLRNYYCLAYKMFYSNCLDRLIEIARMVRNGSF